MSEPVGGSVVEPVREGVDVNDHSGSNVSDTPPVCDRVLDCLPMRSGSSHSRPSPHVYFGTFPTSRVSSDTDQLWGC